MVITQERILVIEDEADISCSMKARLEAAGYEVQTALDGAEGISQAMECQPDLVILDVRLPDMGGYEVCQELRKRYEYAALPILMFTVMDGPNDDIHGLAAGANAYLTKTCAPAELLECVNQLLRDDA